MKRGTPGRITLTSLSSYPPLGPSLAHYVHSLRSDRMEEGRTSVERTTDDMEERAVSLLTVRARRDECNENQRDRTGGPSITHYFMVFFFLFVGE